jgi:hypothetical protein
MMRTPGLVPFVIGGTLIAVGAMAGPAHAQAQPQAQTRQQASAPDVRPPSGPHLVPYVGVSSFLGDSGKGVDPGLRVGALAGGHLTSMFSLNGEITVDFQNWSGGVDHTGINLDMAVSPLVHVPLNNFELVFGPKLGAWFGADNTSVTLANFDLKSKTTSHGWLAGLNAGGFVSLNKSVELGGLLSFVLRDPTSACTENNQALGPKACTSSGLTSPKVLAFTVALLF